MAVASELLALPSDDSLRPGLSRPCRLGTMEDIRGLGQGVDALLGSALDRQLDASSYATTGLRFCSTRPCGVSRSVVLLVGGELPLRVGHGVDFATNNGGLGWRQTAAALASMDLSPAISVFVSLLIAVGGLYILRIPQAARIMSQGFTNLSRAQERRIGEMEKRIDQLEADLEAERADCERRINELQKFFGRTPR